jgi:glycosyltransferase involved in cell wall biosynthesis
MNKVSGISVIVPAYNEEKGIGNVLSELKRTFEQYSLKNNLPYELIVVDDGSSDRTAELVSSAGLVKLIRHSHNKGYGASLKLGIRKSNFDVIGIIDGDGSYEPEDFIKLLDGIVKENYDMAVGIRTSKGAKIPFTRRPAKFILGRLINYLMKENVPDFNSGLRVFRKDIAESLFDILPSGFSFTTTLTLAMLGKDYRIKYEQIKYNERIGASKISPIRDVINFISLILRTILYFNPLKIFIPLSTFLFILAIIVFFISKFYIGKIADITVTIIIFSALQILAIGMLADLIDKRSRL